MAEYDEKDEAWDGSWLTEEAATTQMTYSFGKLDFVVSRYTIDQCEKLAPQIEAWYKLLSKESWETFGRVTLLDEDIDRISGNKSFRDFIRWYSTLEYPPH